MNDIVVAKDFYETIFNWEVTANTGYDEYAFFKDTCGNVMGLWSKE